jgi:hypothetical protein
VPQKRKAKKAKAREVKTRNREPSKAERAAHARALFDLAINRKQTSLS